MTRQDPPQRGFLGRVFGRVTSPFINGFFKAADPHIQKLDYTLVNYPTKAVGATGLCGDMMFLVQTVASGNHVGTAAAIIGAYASTLLIRYGDPKIPEDERFSFVEPQDVRRLTDWVKNPEKYPWEYFGLFRTSSMGLMLAGGMVGSSYGEIGYAGLAIAGYAIKMGVAQKPPHSVDVPDESRGLLRAAYKVKAYVQENPNPVVSYIGYAALMPYAAEAILESDRLKFGSAMLWFLPTVLMMYSSKRAQTLLPPPAPSNGL